MAVGYRCSLCDIDWPDPEDDGRFKTCPQCGEDCGRRMRDLKPVSLKEAESLKRHADFERFYEEEWPAIRAERDASQPAVADAEPARS